MYTVVWIKRDHNHLVDTKVRGPTAAPLHPEMDFPNSEGPS